jgi:hypothetical protein
MHDPRLGSSLVVSQNGNVERVLSQEKGCLSRRISYHFEQYTPDSRSCDTAESSNILSALTIIAFVISNQKRRILTPSYSRYCHGGLKSDIGSRARIVDGREEDIVRVTTNNKGDRYL